MLRYTTLLLCLTLLSSTRLISQTANYTTATDADSQYLDSTNNQIFVDLEANAEFCDSIYSENKLLKKSLLNASKQVGEYKSINRLNNQISVENNEEIIELKQQVKVKQGLIKLEGMGLIILATILVVFSL